MKRLIYFLLPIIFVAIIVFGVLKVFILGDLGKGALQVTSKPFSKVYLDNSYIGTTPLCRCEAANMLRGGTYTLRLVPIDGKTNEFQDKITITKGVLTVVDRKFGAGGTSEGSIVSLEKLTNDKSSELLVITFPDKADIYLDGDYQNKSPYHKSSVTDSDHALRIKKDGYKDKNVRIRTPAGYKLVAVVYMGLMEEDMKPTDNPTPAASVTPTLSITPRVIAKITILETPNGFLRVRSDPTINSSEISRVSTGDIFDLIEEGAGWYKIKLPNGTSGWINADYASKQ